MPSFFLFFFHTQPNFFKTNFNMNTQSIKIKMYTTNFHQKIQYAMTKKVNVAMFQQGPTAIAFLPKTEFTNFLSWYTANKYSISQKNSNINYTNLQLLLLGGFFFEKNKKSVTYNAYFINHYQIEKTKDKATNFNNGCILFEHEFIEIFENLIFKKLIFMTSLLNYQYYVFYNTLLQKKNLIFY